MPDGSEPHAVSVRSATTCLTAWTATAQEAQALAEALNEARPGSRIRIDGKAVVFSREGRVIDLGSAETL